MKRGEWTETLIYYSGGYTVASLQECVQDIVTYMCLVEPQNNIYIKYNKSHTYNVSKYIKTWVGTKTSDEILMEM